MEKCVSLLIPCVKGKPNQFIQICDQHVTNKSNLQKIKLISWKTKK